MNMFMKKLIVLCSFSLASQSLLGSQQLSNKTKIVSHDPAIDVDLYRSLIKFCKHNQINELKEILKKGVNPDLIRTSDYGLPLITCVIKHKQYEVLSTLLEDGRANPDIPDINEDTAVSYALVAGDQKALDLLLRAKANVNVQNNKGVTALMVAVAANNLEGVIKLLHAKANVNLQNKWKKTALMIAVHEEHYNFVSMLLKAHANPEIVDEDGNDALDFALANENEDIWKMLQQAILPGLSDVEDDV